MPKSWNYSVKFFRRWKRTSVKNRVGCWHKRWRRYVKRKLTLVGEAE